MKKWIYHKYEESEEAYYCDFCNAHIITLKDGEALPDRYKGLNYNVNLEVRCPSCKNSHERAYDSYMTNAAMTVLSLTASPDRETEGV